MTRFHRLSISFLKLAPVIAAILMLIHVILLLCGVHLFIAENLVALPIIPCIVCCIWSKAFGFCKLHRSFIVYTSLVTYCINWQADALGFGCLLLCARWLMVVIGIVLLGIFLYKQHKNKYKIFKHECENETGSQSPCENCGRFRHGELETYRRAIRRDNWAD